MAITEISLTPVADVLWSAHCLRQGFQHFKKMQGLTRLIYN